VGKVSGQLSGTISGTATFTGTNESGTVTRLRAGYLDSRDVLPGRARAKALTGPAVTPNRKLVHAFMLPNTMFVGEGQIALTDGEFTWSGKIAELT